MATYRVFEFKDALPDAIERGDNIRLVREGFSIWPVFFPFLWLLWHRLWVGLLVFVALTAGFFLLSDVTNPFLGILLSNLFGFFLAIEGTNWQAKKLEGNGWQEINVVLAGDLEEAEHKAFYHYESQANEMMVEMLPNTTPLPARKHLPKSPPLIGGFMTTPKTS